MFSRRLVSIAVPVSRRFLTASPRRYYSAWSKVEKGPEDPIVCLSFIYLFLFYFGIHLRKQLRIIGSVILAND